MPASVVFPVWYRRWQSGIPNTW